MSIEQKESCSGNYFTGMLLVGIGVLFLLINLNIIPSLQDTWPAFIIIAGLAFIVGGLGKSGKSKKSEDE